MDQLERLWKEMMKSFEETIQFYGQEGVIPQDCPEELCKMMEEFHQLLEKANEDNRRDQQARKVPQRYVRQHGTFFVVCSVCN
jgi:hypothetical protein